MARDGSGNFSLLGTLAPPGTTNDPTTINAIMADIASAMSDSINTAGTKPWAANQPMAGFKLTGLGDGTSASDSASLSQVQKGNKNLATVVGGTVDAIALTFSPPLTTLSAGMEIKWISAGANTITGVTIAIDAIGGTKIVKKGASAALAVGDTGVVGYLNKATYNGTDWIQDNPAVAASISLATTTDVLTGTDATKAVTSDALAALWEQGADIASAATISVGEGGYFFITGTTGITDIDFATDKTGREAALKFNGILLLTHSATLILPAAGANITTAAGDVAIFKSEGTDIVRCVSYMRASGAAVVAPAAGLTVIHKATLDTRASASFANDSDFTFSMLANTNYIIKFHYKCSNTGGAATGFNIGLSGPAIGAGTVMLTAAMIGNSGANTFASTVFDPTATGTVLFTQTGTANSSYIITGEINWRNGANAGTFVLQTARQSGSGSALFAVGSTMTYMTYA